MGTLFVVGSIACIWLDASFWDYYLALLFGLFLLVGNPLAMRMRIRGRYKRQPSLGKPIALEIGDDAGSFSSR
jgi:hypothetical protein